MLMIANKAFHPEAGYNYQELPLYRSLSSAPVKRRRSFSYFEQATYKKPVFIDTKTAFSKPRIETEDVRFLVDRARALGWNGCDMMITYEFTKEAFKALSLPFPKRPLPLVAQNTATHPHFEWSLVPCEILKSNTGVVVVTESHAIRISKLKEEYYNSQLKNEEAIIRKINPYNNEIGLPFEKITRLGMKCFHLYEQVKSPRRFYRFEGLSHVTDAHVQSCGNAPFSSKEELLTAASDIIHQVEIFHRVGVCHMDIKPENICKTKEGRFKVIDRCGSLDFTNKDVMRRIKDKKFDFTGSMFPKKLEEAFLEVKTNQEAEKLAKAADVFATGSTIYRWIFDFGTPRSRRKIFGPATAFPYFLTSEGRPSGIRFKEELSKTLQEVTPLQQQLIISTLSIKNQPTLKELKEGFPFVGIEKKKTFS